MRVDVPAARPLVGKLQVPGDKSLGHRALLYGAVRQGTTTVAGLGRGIDVAATVDALRGLGVAVKSVRSMPGGRPGARGHTITGAGFAGLRAQAARLDCGNSGTSIRLLMGLLAGVDGTATLDGDASLRTRPMERVAAPLRAMGARITTAGGCPPVAVAGGGLTGHDHTLPMASAQVKSALLLAGLQASGRTTISEPGPSRDHTERALRHLGAPVGVAPGRVWVDGPVAGLGEGPLQLVVPGDLSSACFLLAAALLLPGSDIRVDGLCLNPSRTGALEVWRAMGAELDWSVTDTDALGEPVGWVRARHSTLTGVRVAGEQLVRALDEIPVLAATAAAAGVALEVADAAELRIKESDRLATMAAGLRALGSQVTERDDGLLVDGGTLGAAEVDGVADHRVAMALYVAALGAGAAGTRINGWEGVATSYPEFLDDLAALGLDTGLDPDGGRS